MTAGAELSGHWRAAWTAALDAVEIDVDLAEELIDQLHSGADAPQHVESGDWIAPALLGPMPSEFADRARALLARQSEVSEQLASAMVQARTQARGLSKLDHAERAPVFIDTAV